jgi:predicted acetyltransferase
VTTYGCQVSSEIRNATKAELGDYIGCLHTAFLGEREVTNEEVEWRAARDDLTRTFCAFSGGELAGTSRTFPTSLTVPGGSVRAAAVTEVSVLPTQRRRGHLTGMMTAMLDDARRRGEPVAILIASEWGIYGRYGYGPASERISFEISTTNVRFREPATGSIELVRIHDLRDIAPSIYDRILPTTVGALTRDPGWWDLILNLDVRPGMTISKSRVRVIWRDSVGLPQGYAIYDTTEHWDDGLPAGEVLVRELVAATPEAHRELWRYVCELDLARTVRAVSRPVDEPVAYYLVNGRQVRQLSKFDHLWLRILDLPATLSARKYLTTASLVLEVTDETSYSSEPTSRFRIEGDPSGGSALPTDDEPDIVTDIATISATYLGGTSFAAMATAGRVVERVDGAVARADALFGIKPLPYLTTNF